MAVEFECWLRTRGRGRHSMGKRSTCQAAKNLVERPYRGGFAEVIKTGGRKPERWQRQGGAWFKLKNRRQESYDA